MEGRFQEQMSGAAEADKHRRAAAQAESGKLNNQMRQAHLQRLYEAAERSGDRRAMQDIERERNAAMREETMLYALLSSDPETMAQLPSSFYQSLGMEGLEGFGAPPQSITNETQPNIDRFSGMNDEELVDLQDRIRWAESRTNESMYGG